MVDLYGAIVERTRIIGKYKKLDSVASFRDVDRRVAESVNEIIELDKKNQQKLKQILPNVGKGVANGLEKNKKTIMELILFTVIVIFAFINISYIWIFIKYVIKIFMPFIIGAMMAFVLNVLFKCSRK